MADVLSHVVIIYGKDSFRVLWWSKCFDVMWWGSREGFFNLKYYLPCISQKVLWYTPQQDRWSFTFEVCHIMWEVGHPIPLHVGPPKKGGYKEGEFCTIVVSQPYWMSQIRGQPYEMRKIYFTPCLPLLQHNRATLCWQPSWKKWDHFWKGEIFLKSGNVLEKNENFPGREEFSGFSNTCLQERYSSGMITVVLVLM